ncbi:MAG: (Fe-S)-binding protein [Candidatus Acididesulfobacter diazotrophicus]|uniref:(Fe-S)-binding protein n=1 Tax=Candidatus Acididesulfobacter diazotrophicus TaxID=2597226 RepID=A0A519BMK8_9DELT|nr:MAG: (Fe-S)-binding protein [Candidatus Acididesulfobacter diazotrophicus]
MENILNTSLKSYENCVKCGKCLPACPSYNFNFNEFFSPRGRIRLIASEIKDELPLKISKFEKSMSACLLCGRCTDICPNGVKTGPLVIEEKFKLNKLKTDKFSIDNFVLKALKGNSKFLFSAGLRFSNILKFNNLNIPKPSGKSFILHNDLNFSVRNNITKNNSEDCYENISIKKNSYNINEEKTNENDENYTDINNQITSAKPQIKEEISKNNLIKVGYFSGCVFNNIYPEISKSTVSALNKNNISVFVPSSQSCCGLPHISSGDINSFKKLAINNALSFKNKKLDYIITSCASCSFSINKLYPLYFCAEEKNEAKEKDRLEILNFSKKLIDIWNFFNILKKKGIKIKQGNLDKKLDVVFHIPCHLKNSADFIPFSKNEQLIGEAGSIIDNINGLNLKPLKHNYCCGNGGMFNIRHYSMSKEITKKKFSEIKEAIKETDKNKETTKETTNQETAAQVILTSCSGCILSLKDQKNILENDKKIPVKHLIEIYDKSIKY